MSDDELVRLSIAGDRAAFAALAERHYGLMFKVAWQWCGRRDDAEDIAQESAIKLARNIGSFHFDSAVTTWLYRLVINTAKDYFRAQNTRRGRETPMAEDFDAPSAAPTPEQQLSDKDVIKAINALPENLKETVILVCCQGLSHAEAGKILGCSEGTISWRVHEARKKLAAGLDEKNKEKRHG
ncbi:MAG: RNA polymerase sigma factor [Bdellovibrionales bacterium]